MAASNASSTAPPSAHAASLSRDSRTNFPRRLSVPTPPQGTPPRTGVDSADTGHVEGKGVRHRPSRRGRGSTLFVRPCSPITPPATAASPCRPSRVIRFAARPCTGPPFEQHRWNSNTRRDSDHRQPRPPAPQRRRATQILNVFDAKSDRGVGARPSRRLQRAGRGLRTDAGQRSFVQACRWRSHSRQREHIHQLLAIARASFPESGSWQRRPPPPPPNGAPDAEARPNGAHRGTTTLSMSCSATRAKRAALRDTRLRVRGRGRRPRSAGRGAAPGGPWNTTEQKQRRPPSRATRTTAGGLRARDETARRHVPEQGEADHARASDGSAVTSSAWIADDVADADDGKSIFLTSACATARVAVIGARDRVHLTSCATGDRSDTLLDETRADHGAVVDPDGFDIWREAQHSGVVSTYSTFDYEMKRKDSARWVISSAHGRASTRASAPMPASTRTATTAISRRPRAGVTEPDATYRGPVRSPSPRSRTCASCGRRGRSPT